MLTPRMCVTLVFFAITPSLYAQSPNLLPGGDFQNMVPNNPWFTTQYLYRDPTTTSPLTMYDPGTYTYAPNLLAPILLHNNPSLPNFFDHTFGNANGMFMVVNGSINANDKLISTNLAVLPQSDYTFSMWTTAWNNSNNHLPELDVKINGVSVGKAVPTGELGAWTQFAVSWNSGASSNAQIDITDLNLDYGGNDLAIDDISFTLAGGGDAAAVPEPTSIVLMGATLLGTGGYWFIKRRGQRARKQLALAEAN